MGKLLDIVEANRAKNGGASTTTTSTSSTSSSSNGLVAIIEKNRRLEEEKAKKKSQAELLAKNTTTATTTPTTTTATAETEVSTPELDGNETGKKASGVLARLASAGKNVLQNTYAAVGTDAAKIMSTGQKAANELVNTYSQKQQTAVRFSNDYYDGGYMTDDDYNQLSEWDKTDLRGSGISDAESFNKALDKAKFKDYRKEMNERLIESTLKYTTEQMAEYQAKANEEYAAKGEDLTGVGKFLYNLAPAAGNLAVDIASNYVVPGSGIANMITRAYGNSYNDAVAQGYDDAKASTYGALKAAISYATNMIGNIGGSSAAYGKGSGLEDIIKKQIAKIPSKTWAKIGLRTAGNVLEGVEEVSESMLDPVSSAVLTDNPELEDFFDKLASGEVDTDSLGAGASQYLASVGEGYKNMTGKELFEAFAGGYLISLVASGATDTAGAITTKVKGETSLPTVSNELEQYRAEAQAKADAEAQAVADREARLKESEETIAQAKAQAEAREQLLNTTVVPSNDANTNYTKLANDILHDETMQERYTREFGEIIQGKSTEEKVKNIISKIRAKQSENAVAQQNAEAQAKAEAQQKAMDEVNSTEPMEDASHPMAYPTMEGPDTATEGQIGAVMQIRQMMRDGASYSDAATIVDDPVARQVFEDIADIKLSSNRGKAKAQVVEWAKTLQAETNSSTKAVPVETEQTEYDSYVRGLILNGETDEILWNPQYREVFEGLTGKKLSGDVKTAREQILAQAENFKDSQTQYESKVVRYGPADEASHQSQHERKNPFVKEKGAHEKPTYDKTHNKANNLTSENGEHVTPEPYQGKHAVAEDEEISENSPEYSLRENRTKTAQNPFLKDTQQITQESKAETKKGENEEFNSKPSTTETKADTTSTEKATKSDKTEAKKKTVKKEKTSEETTKDTDKITSEKTKRQIEQKNNPAKAETSSEAEVNERGFSENVRTDRSMNKKLREKYEKNPLLYDVLSNKTTLNKALDIIEQGVNEAERQMQEWITMGKNGMKIPPEAVPLSKMVANELMSQGRGDVADQIISDIAVELTTAGQFGQAAIILRNANPITALKTIENAVKKINTEIEKKYGKKYTWRASLTDEEIELIKNTDFTEKDAFKNVYKQIAKRLGSEMPSTLREKDTELRKTFMLLNLKTIIKNIAANIPTIGIRASDNALSGAIQDVLVKSGKISKDEQTRTLKTTKEAKAVANEVAGSMIEQLEDDSQKYDLGNVLAKERTIFKTKTITIGGKELTLGNITSKAVGKVTNKLTESSKTKGAYDKVINALHLDNLSSDKATLENLRQATYGLLEAGDAPFVRSAFKASLANYCSAHGITTAADVTQEAIDHAYADAMYYTYKNANILAKGLNKLKTTKAGTLVDLILPFTTTPANILAMTFDHSIGAAVNAAYDANHASAVEVADDIAKGATGIAITALGFALRNLGAITGGADDDDDKAALDKATGKQEYSIGGKVSYDWAEPAGSLLALGAEISDAISGEKEWQTAMLDALYTSGDAILDMSLFQNVKDMLTGYGSATENVVGSLISAGISQHAPSFLSAIANTEDSSNRATYDKNMNNIESGVAQFKSKLPGLRETLDESVNVKGETETKGNKWQRFINNFLNPATVNHGEENEIDTLIYDYYDRTGDTSVFPEVAPYKYDDADGNEVVLTTGERSVYQKTYATTYYETMNEWKKDGVFDNLSDEAFKKLVSNLRSYATVLAKKEVSESNGAAFDDDDYIYAKDYENVILAKSLCSAANIKFEEGKDVDYETIDYVVENVYRGSTILAKEAIEKSYGNIEKIAEANKVGLTSEKWAKYNEKRKSIENGTGTSTDKQEKMNIYIDTDKTLTSKQKDLLKEQMTYWTTIPADDDTYEALVDAGISPTTASKIRSDKSDLVSQSYENKYEIVMQYASNAEEANKIWAVISSSDKKTFTERYPSAFKKSVFAK